VRLPRTAQVVLSNRQFGPEQVLRVVDERCPGDMPNIEDYVPRAEMEEIARRYKAIAGFEVEALNRRRSYDEPLTLDEALNAQA
jgi:hypothetical protein